MKKILKIILIVFISIAVILILLEITSRIYKCKKPFKNVSSPCSIIIHLPEGSELLANLREKRMVGDKISKEEYRQAADMLILEEEPKKLDYRNGISCGSYGYVRNNLPKQAKKFVKRHELEHLLQTGKEINREFSANLAAGKEYPMGLIQTIFFSLKTRIKYYDSPVCYILSLWKTFKIYFLP